MGATLIVRYLFHVLILLFLQVFLFRDMAVFGFAFFFAHIGIVLLMPIELSLISAMAIAFGAGFLIDMFYDTMGLHAAASVLIAFVRPKLVQLFSVQGELNNMQEYSVGSGGVLWFFQYALVSCFIFSAVLFIVEATTFSILLYAGFKIIMTTLFTASFLTLYSYLWASRTSKRR
jgi:hypothetical protein